MWVGSLLVAPVLQVITRLLLCMPAALHVTLLPTGLQGGPHQGLA